METKLFELRDKATMISAIGISVSRDDGWLAERAGYGDRLILFGNLRGGVIFYDPYSWANNSRTWRIAHGYVSEHWDELKSGDMIDVEFILGETTEKKVSESEECGVNYF